MRPIPKKLLIHAVTLSRLSGNDRWGKDTELVVEELDHVRMEPSDRVIRDKNNAEVQLAATLFYDCKNSRPAGVEFQTDDIIAFNEEKFRVQSVEPLYDERCLHHYELGLVKHA